MASKPPPSSPTASPTASPYPFAAAPDIVRAHQKDAYFTGHLANTISDLYRRLFGARATHSLAPELRSLAALLYFALTTLPGNRTLGEEYCDLVQVESPTGRLPDVRKRAAYIAGTILLPYLAGRALPGLRGRLRRLIDGRLDALRRKGSQAGREARERNAHPAAADVSLDHANSYSANSDLLLAELGARGPQESRVDLALTTHTPVSPSPRFDLAHARAMGYIRGSQQRKCTLCLEEMKDPSATQCGHVFCWECIGDWVREKPECPLCRREAMVQHILPLRVM
ncbi:RING-1 like protein [Metarhizium acridum CQMa 102]|uniref:RING-type E3 ubiquitin transferase n=1 Tax=Metarhizium acridum (strain CQMa 102) TaxID=655827 RepID=E9EE33_METAQ|nr:RING-1 like protein [Metarhizium acridum CQMa 102]EFY85819.1 RING-1 like protein [Metarhizium acridum CQMa 102]